MARKKPLQGLNRHQKAARRPGEERVGREMVEELLQLSRSPDPADREHAASFLCPCHVRRRIEEVWNALFRMMEDEDVRVRRAAWHTLEDGGKPDDPRLDRLLDRLSRTETDRRVRSFIDIFSGQRRKKADLEFQVGRPFRVSPCAASATFAPALGSRSSATCILSSPTTAPAAPVSSAGPAPGNPPENPRAWLASADWPPPRSRVFLYTAYSSSRGTTSA